MNKSRLSIHHSPTGRTTDWQNNQLAEQPTGRTTNWQNNQLAEQPKVNDELIMMKH
jgi:hypothetical protein